jgi:outer membrane biosynthesis protein TonB
VPKDQSKIPLPFRFDTPPKLKVVAVPIYPYELRREKIQGKVRAALMIDPSGRVSEC